VSAGEAAIDWNAVDAEGERSRLRAVLTALSAGERELLLLVAWDGLIPAQAAQALGIPVATPRSRLHRARLRGQRILNDSDVDRPPSDLDTLTTLLQHKENPA
jgi:RNA polymerase sigma-70 factor, ECF subfamily